MGTKTRSQVLCVNSQPQGTGQQSSSVSPPPALTLRLQGGQDGLESSLCACRADGTGWRHNALQAAGPAPKEARMIRSMREWLKKANKMRSEAEHVFNKINK